jgi:hypothetical protein
MLGLIATIQINFVIVNWNILCISLLHGVVYTLHYTEGTIGISNTEMQFSCI